MHNKQDKKSKPWHVPLVIVTVMALLAIVWKFTSDVASKDKLINGSWHIITMETENGQVAYYPTDSDSSTSPDLFFVEHSGHLWVSSTKLQLNMPCKVTRNEVSTEGGEYTIFKIIDISTDRLIVEAMVVGQMRTIGNGQKVELINIP